jgi:proline dehydrogenase
MNVLNKAISLVLPYIPKPIVRKVSERYIAGATLNDAVRTVRALNAKGAMATVDVLGEFIEHPSEAERNATYSIEVVRRLAADKLEANLSIKLTSLGLGLDVEECEQNVRRILTAAKESGSFVRFDMENSPYTTLTIDLFLKLRRDFPNIGIVLQAYMRRTSSDIRRIVDDANASGLRNNFRLCKGIYIEPEEIAFKSRSEVQQNYLKCLRQMIEAKAYVGIATHDDVLIAGARALIKAMGLTREQYEFQMLLGVRESIRDGLLAEGHRLRVYVPFGEDWYGYSVRRLKENPSVGGYIVKAIFSGK